MNEAINIDYGRINVVIVERLEQLRLCVTCDPKDDRATLITRFKPEGAEWSFVAMEDQDDYVYLHYQKFYHPDTYDTSKQFMIGIEPIKEV